MTDTTQEELPPPTADARQEPDDLAMLVRRLAHALKKSSPDSDLAAQALGYLSRHGLSGNQLRDAPVVAPPAVACDWWQEEEEDSDTYSTACGEMFCVSDGSEDIGGWAKFCCYCSKPLALHRWGAPRDDEAEVPQHCALADGATAAILNSEA